MQDAAVGMDADTANNSSGKGSSDGRLGQLTTMSLHMSLPLLGVGLLTLVLCFCFCCYLWKLKRQSHAERGYRQIKFTSNSKKIKNDMCPVCLEEFSCGEKLAVCPCRHGFHLKCLQQWLSQHNTCPMCKTRVVTPAEETTGLITSTSAV